MEPEGSLPSSKQPSSSSYPVEVNPVHTTASYLSKIHFSIIHRLRLGIPSGLFSSGFPIHIFYMHSSSPSFVLHALPISSSLTDHSNYTSRRVQGMKLLITQFSSTSRHFISLWSKYPPQHPVLKQNLFIFVV
jgi:hypothetical protein